MRKVKNKIIMAGLSLGILATTLSSVSTTVYAASNINASYTASNGIITTKVSSSDYKTTNDNNIYGDMKIDINVLDIANKIESMMKNRNFNGDNAAYCKGLMESAFYAANSQYNVVVMDLSQKYKCNISNIKYYGTYQYGGTKFGVWVFSKLQPKGSYFENDGRRGWDHWACEGWQTQSGNVMWYNK
ncbi:hypothetical protein [Clostridium saccharobutylicum]|uniref:Stress response protein YvgO n=1 Tax=Clostridium saccharobutylicum TaxID=169679 RepID=A0A1S8NGY6_CLOSA|nr:hypothetical protein [Clostridium saccharobutylicum]OOM15735.1 stress response protein YvgO precursor [Clostridium saccharobutylicum]